MEKQKMDQLLQKVFGVEWQEAAKCGSFAELKCWDSLHYVQWIVGVQATFHIELDQKQILGLTSLQALLDLLKEHRISH